MKIIFTNATGVPLETPRPAKYIIPEWYKKTVSYQGDGKKKPNGNGMTNATIKKCVPVFDAITAGYIIATPVDIFVTQINGMAHYEWPSLDAINWHPIEQAPLHPAKGKDPYPKLINPWGIQTPKGYSCLFTAPMHRDNVIIALDGVVDTDTYNSPVNFPFVLKNPLFEGLISAGTPIAQVIPFKRENWKMSVGSNHKKINDTNNVLALNFFDRYKNRFWSRKEYN